MINYDYLDTHFLLIECFMQPAYNNILDVSYKKTENILSVQVVLLESTVFSEILKQKIILNLSSFEINFIEIYLTKEKFNENNADWLPKYYKWFDYMLFSKAKAL